MASIWPRTVCRGGPSSPRPDPTLPSLARTSPRRTGLGPTTVRLAALAALACSLLQAIPSTGPAQTADAKWLLKGVHQIAAPGVPGPLCVFGPNAFPLVVGRADENVFLPVVAAGRLVAGRVVAFGHTGYLDASALKIGDTGTLLVHAVQWASGQSRADASARRVAVRRLPGVAEFLRDQGFRAVALDNRDWLAKLKYAEVACLRPSNLSDEEVKTVAAFVQGGGGLIVADLGWGWLQLHPGKNLQADHPGNRLLGPAGILWADGTLQRTAAQGFSVENVPPALTHAALALAAVVGQGQRKRTPAPAELAQASAVLLLAARSLPADDAILRPRLASIRQKRAAGMLPRPDRPLKAGDALTRLSITLELEELKALAPDQVKAHPTAESFPGAVPAATPRVARTVRIDTAIPGWRSTGLYAAPGDLVRATFPQSAVGKRLTVRIGAHADRLWRADAWKRFPEICRRFPVNAAVTPAANAFGGPIYLEVPGGCDLGTIEVGIAQAVESPYFVLGETSSADWRAAIRRRPAPWAELEGRRVILSVPSEVVRDLDDPQSLMEFWDRVVAACDELSGKPVQPRRQRYVADVQISAGYMHSGYPIMTHLDVARLMVDRARIAGFKQDGAWGFFHEMGHNYQSSDWTFDGTGEVTCNLFTLYVFHQVCQRDGVFQEKVSPRSQREMLSRYRRGGRPFDEWKRDPFLALMMYVQLQEAFGWEPFKKVFAEYRGLPAADRPKTDERKRDQWMVRFSRAVNRNLGPFFQAWGVPTSTEARAQLAKLPAWMPAELGENRQ